MLLPYTKTIMSVSEHLDNSDPLLQFKAAFENRYTWDPGFKGYQGSCALKTNDKNIEGEFFIANDLKPNVKGIEEEQIAKLITSQLWEVAIHRVRRAFNDVHGSNTFDFGDVDDVGVEIIVGGKNQGDKYRIKDNIVTMVYRHIHGSLINIFTNKIIDTGYGYLSNLYTSQYLDPVTGKPSKGKSHYEDDFVSLDEGGQWVLSRRSIMTEGLNGTAPSKYEFTFSNLNSYDLI